METPFKILCIAEDASDNAIKQAYLAKVREYPPDRDPLMFQKIRAAYEAVRHHKERLRHALFHVPEPDLPALRGILAAGRGKPSLDEAAFTAYLQYLISNYRLETE